MREPKTVFRQIMFNYFRGPVYLRMKRIQLIENEDNGSISVYSFKRVFGNIWKFKKEIICPSE